MPGCTVPVAVLSAAEDPQPLTLVSPPGRDTALADGGGNRCEPWVLETHHASIMAALTATHKCPLGPGDATAGTTLGSEQGLPSATQAAAQKDSRTTGQQFDAYLPLLTSPHASPVESSACPSSPTLALWCKPEVPSRGTSFSDKQEPGKLLYDFRAGPWLWCQCSSTWSLQLALSTTQQASLPTPSRNCGTLHGSIPSS